MSVHLQHYVGVQALRAFSALLVLVPHVTFYAAERIDPTFPTVGQGLWGVWLFFAISGFVMQISVTRRPAQRWSAFAVARLARIAPLYWIVTTIKLLSILVGSGLALHAVAEPWPVVASYLFLPSRNVEGQIQPLYGVGWTLVFEMAFYALVTVAVALRVDPLRVCAPTLLLLAALSVLRPADAPAWTAYASPFVLFFLLGMLVARWTTTGDHRRLVLTVAGLALCFAITTSSAKQTVALVPTIVFVAVAAVLIGTVAAESRLVGRVPSWLLVLGASSFSLYLVHPMAGRAVVAALAAVGCSGPVWATVGAVAALVVSLLAGPLLHRGVEQPLARVSSTWSRRLRRRQAVPGTR